MSDKIIPIKVGDTVLCATYDQLEELYDTLDDIFGLGAVQLTEEDEKEIIAEIQAMFLGIDPKSNN